MVGYSEDLLILLAICALSLRTSRQIELFDFTLSPFSGIQDVTETGLTLKVDQNNGEQ